MNILVVGESAGLGLAQQAYPDEVIDYMPKFQSRKRDYYDAVICFNDLVKVGIRETVDHLKNVGKVLKEEGSLTLFVPALEWVAEELYKENPSPVVQIVLYGNQKKSSEYHTSGYMMRGLRRDLALAGFAVTHASQGLYELQWQGPSGEIVSENVGQNILIAYKRKEKDNVPYTIPEG